LLEKKRDGYLDNLVYAIMRGRTSACRDNLWKLFIKSWCEGCHSKSDFL